ncbi:MAG: hypothetical protein WCP89_03440 [archaeon]
MRVLFVSRDLMAAHLAIRIQSEGHEVKLFIDLPEAKENLDNLITKTNDWRAELSWVGKTGLIVFDHYGYGQTQDDLRTEGYRVFGGCAAGDDLETDRQKANAIFSQYGIKSTPVLDFPNVTAAIEFVEKNPAAWVIKQNGGAAKCFNYVGSSPDGRDVLEILRNYSDSYDGGVVSLQARIDGVEIGAGRYFNGHDWVGPIEVNLEHKKLFPGDLGPTTSEMGTLAWYDDNEQNKLFLELDKLVPYLREINFKGDFEINFIVNETGAYALEATPRFGSPIIYLQMEFHQSPWCDFLCALADGEPYDLKWKRGYGVVALVAVPPFPFGDYARELSMKGVEIMFSDQALKNGLPGIYFENTAYDLEHQRYYISDHRGYILYSTGVADNVAEARRITYDRIKDIYIPKMFYRNDIGEKFMSESEARLRGWGYL